MYIAVLDYIKFCLVILVCILHYNYKLAPQAYLSVELFFMISGFLLALNYDKYIKIRYVDLILKKCFYIFPVYWIAILIGSLMGNYLNVPWGTILGNVFMLNGIGLAPWATYGNLWFFSVYLWTVFIIISIIKSFNKVHSNFLIGVLGFLIVLIMHSRTSSVNYTYELFLIGSGDGSGGGVIMFGLARGFVAMSLGYLCGISGFRINSAISFWISILFFLKIVFHQSVTIEFDYLIYLIGIVILSTAPSISFKLPIINSLGKKLSKLSMPMCALHIAIFDMYSRILNRLNFKINTWMMLISWLCLVIIASIFYIKFCKIIKKSNRYLL